MAKRSAAQRKLVKISKEEAMEKGLDRYLTGEPYKYGDIAERDIITGTCLKYKTLIYETGVGGGKKERRSVSCKQCGALFRQKRNDQKICSPKCRLDFLGAHPIAKICEQCGASFVAHRPWANFCSPKCRLANWVPTLKGPDLFA